MSSLLIRGGRVIDPATGFDSGESGCDVLIDAGRIAQVGANLPGAAEVLDAQGWIVTPGLIDLHVGWRDPGHEEDETTATGVAAALAGGFTTIATMPDTNPVVDNASAAEYVILQAGRANGCRVHPLGAVTRGHGGEELADLGQLARSGAVAFTDAKTPVRSAEIMRRALEYARMLGRPIFSHPQDPTLTAGGIMHEGYCSTLLGLRGMPAAAEDILVGRDLALAELTGSRIHLMSVSTRGAVAQIRHAKARGVHVTADVTPHHLCLNDARMMAYETQYKVLPPLRTDEHIQALWRGLADGTIDAISADHQPWAQEKTDREIDQTPFGIVGLETLIPICVKSLIQPGLLTWPQLLAKLTVNPAKILGLEAGTLAVGARADVTLIHPSTTWRIDPSRFHSKSRNTPFAHEEVTGRVMATLVGGEIRYRW